MSLFITNQVIVDDNASIIEPAGWRVATERDENVCLALPLKFQREQDAERARIALEQVGLESEAALLRVGQGTVIRIMLDALAW